MATNQDQSGAEQIDWDDLDDAPETESSEWISPEDGEVVSGPITAYNPLSGDNGIVEIAGRPYSLSYGEAQQVAAALVEGSIMAVKAADETEVFTPDDSDEEIEYYPKELRFKRGDAE